MIQKHKKEDTLNGRDIFLLQRLVDAKIDELDRAISDYVEFGDDVPEWLLDTQLDYYILQDKLNSIS